MCNYETCRSVHWIPEIEIPEFSSDPPVGAKVTTSIRVFGPTERSSRPPTSSSRTTTNDSNDLHPDAKRGNVIIS